MGIYSVETKWNADDQKLHMLMEIEAELEEAFINSDFEKIWIFMGSYRRHSNTKFGLNEQKEINTCFEELKDRYSLVLEKKDVNSISNFYSYAEGLFLKISQKLKESGIYYREGKNASHAVLQR
jgi:hypothetical protein